MSKPSRRKAVRKVVTYLESLKEEGETTIEADLSAIRKLKRKTSAGSATPARRARAAAATAPARTPAPAPASTAPRPAAPASVATAADRKVAAKGLGTIATRISECTRCGLCKTRKNTVPGQGNPRPDLMFIGEGPGADEDEQGLAFVGRAGQLLTKIIEAMGFTRDEVFIGNIVKCRPPGNRVPTPEEMEQCIPYLREQIALLQPRVIVCLGATATKGLFGEGIPGITKIRGQWRSYEGIDVMPTYHPAYLLRNPPGKKDVWDDMKEVLRHLGRPVPPSKGK